MELFITWCGFFGAWLLVAGPIYQAAIELREEEIDRDAFTEATSTAPRPERISPWWWLLPPVAYLMNRKRSHLHRAAIMEALPAEQMAQLVGFMNKATGWLIVAFGAFLIAIKETGELVELNEWSGWLLVVLCFAMLALSLGFTVFRLAAGPRSAAGRDDPRHSDQAD